jgi:hypothetical protein
MSIVDKVKQMLGQHSDHARKGVDKAGDYIDREGGGEPGGQGGQGGQQPS